jgi:E3 ubiquitin-protein ligase BRE1
MQMNDLLKRKEERITHLSIKQLSDDDVEKLQQLEATSAKLKQATGKVEELQTTLNETRSHWAKALGNEKAALASIDEMTNKFNKRWSELAGNLQPDTNNDDSNSPECHVGSVAKLAEQSKEIIELRHKLEQALENVRQAESTRSSLKEALIMNGSLQSKLDEIKAKYAVVQASRNNAIIASSRPVHSSSNADVTSASNKDRPVDVLSVSTPRERETVLIGSSSEKDASSAGNGSNIKTEKLHRDYRRARKDLAAMTASKEAAKAKLERSERERDSLAESNARLLKQITEKDDVNAKSLSTILYLKGQTDILNAEKSILEQQTKTAGQLALAARLATNAKERVTDEVMKEKKAIESRVERLENELAESRAESDRLALGLAVMQGKISTENSELRNALQRVDELIAENEEQRERSIDLETAFAKANREARDAKNKLQSIRQNNKHDTDSIGVGTKPSSNSSSSSAGGSSFTVEQLNMQISVLKSRLACPVCHERDKQCIIMRCRHMHCQQCVDDQISNRSRKCPTCNLKFSEKDVEDIWLNT